LEFSVSRQGEIFDLFACKCRQLLSSLSARAITYAKCERGVVWKNKFVELGLIKEKKASIHICEGLEMFLCHLITAQMLPRSPSSNLDQRCGRAQERNAVRKRKVAKHRKLWERNFKVVCCWKTRVLHRGRRSTFIKKDIETTNTTTTRKGNSKCTKNNNKQIEDLRYHQKGWYEHWLCSAKRRQTNNT